MMNGAVCLFRTNNEMSLFIFSLITIFLELISHNNFHIVRLNPAMQWCSKCEDDSSEDFLKIDTASQW